MGILTPSRANRAPAAQTKAQCSARLSVRYFFFQAEDGIRDLTVTGVQTCALPIFEGYRTEAKMNPPLRSRADVDAVLEGLRDGTLDVLATDHAPPHYDEKEQAFDDEIGRASCRERVQTSEAAGALAIYSYMTFQTA